jgi:hypothetical protein
VSDMSEIAQLYLRKLAISQLSGYLAFAHKIIKTNL